MKKINIIISFFIIVLIMLITNVKAADEACKITMSSDKESVSSGDIVTVNLLMSNINKPTGICSLFGILEYSDDIFEIVNEEDEDLQEQLVGTELEGYNILILYNGENDTDSTIKNPWYALLAKENNGNIIYASTLAEPQKESQIVGKIKLKVKEDVEETPAEILLTNMQALDAEAIANNQGEGFAVSETSIVLKVNETNSNEQPDDGDDSDVQIGNIQKDNGKNQTKNTQVQNIQNKVKNDNIANNNVPYTGIEDTIPIIFILVIIALFAYINYKKYKNI